MILKLITDSKQQISLDSDTLESLRKKGRESLFFFARGILGFSDFTSHIHKPICDALQSPDDKRYLIVLPRDWFKSTIGSVAYPIWRALNNPNVRILIVQNSMSNARKKLQSIKQIIEKNKLLRALYPELLPNKKSVWTAECLTVNREGAYPEGTFEAAGTGTAVTSRHYDLIIEDDTISPEIDDMTGVMQQPTQLEIEKAIGFHRLVHPLLLHPSKSEIVVIGTRWCERDLIGWVMRNTTDYRILSRSARENGKIVWERYNEEVLYELERDMGPYMFSTLFLNTPLCGIDTMFKREWMKYYQNLPAQDLVYCTSVDPASETTAGSSDPDFTVVLTTAISRNTGDIYVVHYNRARMNPGEQIDYIFNHYYAYKPVVVKVEAIAYQRTLVYWIQKRQEKQNMFFYVEPIKGLKMSKVDRIKGLQPYFAAGKIAMRTDMPDLERELLSFPNAAHDDVIDALSMHMDFWFKVGRDIDKAKQEVNDKNGFSGQSIMTELLGRSGKSKSYPYDMGLARQAPGQYRSYKYA